MQLPRTDIVERVKNKEDVPYRPVVPYGHDPEEAPPEVLNLMEKCWDEEPAARPTFREIRKFLKSINKGR